MKIECRAGSTMYINTYTINTIIYLNIDCGSNSF